MLGFTQGLQTGLNTSFDTGLQTDLHKSSDTGLHFTHDLYNCLYEKFCEIINKQCGEKVKSGVLCFCIEL